MNEAQIKAQALRDFKAVIRGEGEPGHTGVMVSVNYVEELLELEAKDLLDEDY